MDMEWTFLDRWALFLTLDFIKLLGGMIASSRFTVTSTRSGVSLLYTCTITIHAIYPFVS
jgi:hypothetical protein